MADKTESGKPGKWEAAIRKLGDDCYLEAGDDNTSADVQRILRERLVPLLTAAERIGWQASITKHKNCAPGKCNHAFLREELKKWLTK